GCRGVQGARPARRAPVDGAEGGGARPEGGGLAARKLHSTREGKPGQAASVRGLSNKGLERSPGRGRVVAWRGCVEARRRSTLSVGHVWGTIMKRNKLLVIIGMTPFLLGAR